ncbi:Uncharacterized protein BP5553_10301 [Venustampulla echinocandica]|uniref:Probable threonine--tRNA ligase, cytoplasmic n=1 Tax=Venustampulla echinocandica TaxID=2656787 RepID=A0A370T9V4_9HELO|nr:Uncharacterized protein BP5553_10301 [Venustampulla echinocandica]RDL30423.1 Uncharacterized protein BP5553_10301 [Venustampulla echinocandica]
MDTESRDTENHKVTGAKEPNRSLELEPPPDFLQHRSSIFDKLKATYDEEVSRKPHDKIEIALSDGRLEIGTAWESTPGLIARTISKSLFERTVISVMDGELWDLERPLEKSCKLEFLDFEHPKGKQVFWHSSAHILGEAAERRFGCHLCNGPPTEDPPGFYYDIGNMNGITVQESDWKPLETIANQAIKEKQPFERLIMSKTNLLEMFKYNKYKVHFIQEKVPDGTSTTVYRCGPLIDLCVGPHVPHTGRIKAFAILKNSSAYWLGISANESLQRIAGVSFPEKKLLEKHKKYLLEAAKRNHRKIGQDQKLFFFDAVSPGSCFFLPHGARIYNAMLDLLKSEYRKRDYDEVITPNMFKADLWKTSGHWDHYDDGMFTFAVEKEQFGLKPMNCPGHCKIFAHRDVSYKNLPMRLADFGVVHRNEFSGALTGLTRVRRFQQDDSHIFCTQEQVEEEIKGIFDFISSVYGLFGFTFKLKLSTRPEKYLGDISTWNEAETKLATALDSFAAATGAVWQENPGDGAFYGPKIDITMYDALRRDHQCGTIQLDFQLPQRFNLQYVAKEEPSGPKSVTAGESELSPGYHRPVMIHRAIFGSFERMFGVLTEHFAGKWPFWLSPRQILIIPIMSAVNGYVLEVQKIFKEKMMYVDVDLSGNTLQKKIRNGQIEQYNFIFVVGAQEQESCTVNIRNRDDQTTQAKGRLIPLQEAIDKLVILRDERRLINAI